MAALLTALLAAACARVPVRLDPVPASEVRLKRFVLMLDGVPFALMDSLWREGHFRAFRPPSRLISTFPSLTGVAFRDIWRETPTNGYEDRYYDRQRDRLAGGLIDHVFNGEEHAGFHRNIDARANGLSAGLAYIVPMTMGREELGQLRRYVRSHMVEDTTLVAYIVSTDALAHRAERDQLCTFLLEIDAFLNALREAAGNDLEIVLFSDHGNDLVPTRLVRLDDSLRAAGYEPGTHVRGPADVAVPRFGLVGSAFLYTWPGQTPAVADIVRRVEGVDFVAWHDAPDRIAVAGKGGTAFIDVDAAADRYRYRPVSSDPLELAPVLDRLHRSGQLAADSSAADSVWLRETLDSPFIDPLRRITLGLRAVRNPADIIVSLAPGYHFGDERADLLVGVTGTHGSLRSTSSLAFAMRTDSALPDPLRSDQLDHVVGLPRRAAERTH
jgi:Type I phosphodiesterase / nucleotide pyrophosphatase